MARVLLAGLFHETHCFIDDVAGFDSFTIRRGDALTARRGDGSQTDGFLAVAEREGWEVMPAVDYGAFPSGPVDHAVFEAFWAELEPRLRAALRDGIDAAFLGLHGAMVTTEEEDPEGELLLRIRALPGAADLPIFCAFDLHATLTERMCRLADGLVCYRENPHIDGYATAERAAELLARCLRTGVRPHMRYRLTPIVLPPTGTGTADSPMRDLEALARQIEAETPAIQAVNVVGGFCYGDAHDAGMSFGIVTDDGDAAEAALDRLAELAWSLRRKGLPAEHDLDEVLHRILPVTKGPVLLVEPADNIGGGAPGDCTDVLRALLRHDVQGGGIILNDPASVAALQSVEIGGRAHLQLGGRGSRLDPGPVALEVTLLSRSDGRFTLDDRHSHLAASQGVHIDMGPSAVVRHRGITILLTTRKTPPWALAQWRSQGVEPTEFSVVGVKSAVAHRRTWDPIAVASYTVTTRGPCTSDPRLLPFRRLRRPVFPLDDLP